MRMYQAVLLSCVMFCASARLASAAQCPAGEYVKGINNNGSLICEAFGQEPVFSGALSQALAGTVGVFTNSADVFGTDTEFTKEVQPGDAIMIADEVFTVESVEDDTHLTLDYPHSTGTLSAKAFVDADLLTIANGAGDVKFAVDRHGDVIGALSRCYLAKTQASNIHTVNTSCKSGYMVTGGGCYSSNSTANLTDSHMRTSGYYCRFSSTASTVTAQAVCCLNR